jgi:hypothetical protein
VARPTIGTGGASASNRASGTSGPAHRTALRSGVEAILPAAPRVITNCHESF